MLTRIFTRQISTGLVLRASAQAGIPPMRKSPEEIAANFPGPFHPIRKRSFKNEERDWYNLWVMQPGAWPVIGFTILALVFATYKVLWLDVAAPEVRFSPYKRERFVWIEYEPDYHPTERRRMFLMPSKFYSNFKNWDYVPEDVKHKPKTPEEYEEFFQAKWDMAKERLPEQVAEVEEEMAEEEED